MLLNDGQVQGKRLVSSKSLAEMTRVQTGDLTCGFVPGMSFGYGFAVVREPQGVTAMLSPGTFGHGGAFGTQAWIDPHRGLFVILLIQRVGMPNADGSDMRLALQKIAFEAVK
jgi:CubicO group peptidase (beta-lactamase class C family)